jgi:predicted nucleic acid-binding Zn ribbon protein
MFIETAANQSPRYFCAVCVISIAAGYVCKAQMRKVQERERRARRHTALEVTQ